MGMSSKKDKRIAEQEDTAKRNKKKNSSPDRYNDPVKDTYRTQGKGDRYRVIDGWYSDEMTEKFNKIFKERQKQWESDSTPPIKYDKDE
jgi:hypothetical protein